MINPYLDTAIAVGVIYFLFSILASIVQELWASFRESRGRMLRKAIYDLLNDRLNSDYGVRLLSHPQFNFLKETDNTLPSYLPATNFAQALIDLITRDAYEYHFKQGSQSTTRTESGQEQNETIVENYPISVSLTSSKKQVELELLPNNANSGQEQFNMFLVALDQMKNSNLKILLQNISVRSTDIQTLTKNIEVWYEEYMKRVNGWYMRSTRTNLRFIGISLAIMFNIQAFDLISEIYSDRQLRDKLVAKGISIVDNPNNWSELYTPVLEKSLSSIETGLNQEIKELTNDSSIHDKEKRIRELQQKALQDRTQIADSIFKLKRKHLSQITDTLRLWELPIGWHFSSEKGTAYSAQGHGLKCKNSFSILWILLGWLASGLAIGAGAPFWFNAINKLVNIRRSGQKPLIETA